MPQLPLSRRKFLQTVAATAAVGPFLSIGSRAAAPMLRHASIGASGQALSDLMSFAKHPAFDLVAVADVDLGRFERLQQRFPKVRVYQDWRELLKKEHANIDSVNVSIPDHMHCLVAMEAMKHGKPVYVQKPLCNTLHETRMLTEYARRKGLTTQMGIQVSSTRPQRYGEALVRSGIVGKIREVHTFSNKSWGDDKPLPPGTIPFPRRSTGMSGWASALNVRSSATSTIRANGAAASALAPAPSAIWAATSTARLTAR